jgi:tetratricopeptide repeat protein 21B
MLLAEIQISNECHSQALASLEMALSFDFEIRHNISFHLLKSVCLKKQGSIDEAISTLEIATNLTSVKDGISLLLKKSSSKPSGKKTATPSEIASIYLELIECFNLRNALADANKCMQEATRMFSGTPEEPRFLLANVQNCMAAGDVDKALNILATIQPHQSCFIAAKSKMADIYLKHKNDVKNFAKCYNEIVQKKPTVEACILLGDAYMNIQDVFYTNTSQSKQ